MMENKPKKEKENSGNKSKPQISPNRHIKEGEQPTVIETIYGAEDKFEIIRKPSIFNSKFYVKKNSEVTSGEFDSLNAALDWSKNKANT